ncbi:hypothetical protein ARMGADRAFT_1080027 [Armillaria gallica]|uniref:DUF6535 domain-containing protein n=1 Tax=Armillaria gallica TaxID=47427 RepID=A0A2H3DZC6_ARMGA|nr:hypothetical protein ARMGADRAFT_1080027 [Armillaria gallica]
MSTASDALPENSGRPAATKPETTNVEAMDNLAEEEDVAAPAHAYAEYVNPAKSRKRFGLKGPAPYRPPKGNDPFNYEEKYPEDAYGEEMGPNARVFRTCVDERAIHDANMVEESRDGVDVLLVFAGLFSAVVTTFVAQTSQSLQADFTEMSANLLFEMINIQRAIASGASLDTVAPSPLSPNITFIASTTSVWVNGLWFTSLSLSLTTALVSVLVKQWLHHYMALPSGTPWECSLLQQFRYAGLQNWHVLVIIGLLPVLMHTALAIFFVGLVIFLGPLQDTIAWVVGVITVIAYMAYLMAHILPLLFPQCPYRTSLCDLLHILYSHVMQYAQHFQVYQSTSNAVKWKDLKELELEAVQSVSGELSVEALYWLFSMSSNPTVQSIALQAIGASLLKDFPVDIANDPFAIDLCMAVLPVFTNPDLENEFDSAKHIVQTNVKAITFHDAIRQYLFTDMTTYLLQVFAVFVHPSNVPSISLSLRILLMFAKFLISRLALKEQVESTAVEVKALSIVFNSIPGHNIFSDANAAIFNILDPFITDTMKSVQQEADSGLYSNALYAYSQLVYMQWHAMSSRSLEVVVNLMFDHYNFNGSVSQWAGEIIAQCLHKGSSTMYSVFHALQCLEYFRHHGYQYWLAKIIEGYLSSLGHHSKSCLEVSVMQKHIEYLHTPDILFNVCSILAVGDSTDPDIYRKEQSRKNILSLVQIERGASAWDECRRRLQKLLEEDGMDFFYRQAYVDGIERIALPEEEIAKQREYIGFAIEVLDQFFAGELDDELVSV